MISDQTNLYAEQHFQSNLDDKSSSSWTLTTATKIRHFLALYILTGIFQNDQKQVPEDLAVSKFR